MFCFLNTVIVLTLLFPVTNINSHGFSSGTSVNDAKEALYEIGATGNVHPGFHGSWAFVGYTGPEQVKWAKNISQPRYQGPAVIEEMLTSPSAEEEISKMSWVEWDIYYSITRD